MDDEETQEQSYSEILQALTTNVGASSSKDPRHVRLAAVTAAIIDVAAARSDAARNTSNAAEGSSSCSASQVYAKAVTALEGTIHQQLEASTLATQVALLELLEVTLRYVSPPSILVATLPLLSRVLRALVALTRDIPETSTTDSHGGRGEGGANAVLRWTCRVTAQLLQQLSQSNNHPADDSLIKQLLGGALLTLLEDRRPKVRKAAQGAIIELLGVDDNRGVPAPNKCLVHVNKAVTQYVSSKLTKARNDNDGSDALHTLGFLESAILFLDYAKLAGNIMEMFSAFVDTKQQKISSNYVALTKVKESTPKILTVCAILSVITVMLRDLSNSRKEGLDQLAPRVLASLLQVNPSLVFRSGTAEYEILQRGRTLYGQAVIAACDRVLESNQDLSCKLLPVSLQLLVLLSKPPDEHPDDASVAETLMMELVQFIRSRVSNLIKANPPELVKCLDDSVRYMTKVLETMYRPTWSVSLMTLVALLERVHTEVEVVDPVNSLLELRNQVAAGSASQQAVQEAFSALVQGVGIDVCWSWIQWQASNVDGPNNPGIGVDAVWILSALKAASSIAQPHQPQLSFFQNQVLSLARACDKLAATSSKEKNFHHSRVLDLWALFPSFCNRPSDISSSLPTLSTTLSRAIVDKRYPQLVTIICGGLRVLCQTFHSEFNPDTDEEDPDRFAMSQASVKLIPVLFKLVSESIPPSSSSGQQDMMQVDGEPAPSASAPAANIAPEQLQSVVDAIASLASFAPKDFLQSILKKLMHRLVDAMQSETGDNERVCALLSLSQGLVSSGALNEPEVSLLFRTLKPLIRNDNHGARVQKRAYKVLAELCDHHHAIVTEIQRLKELTSLLSNTMMTSQVSARYTRLKCLNILVEGFDGNESEELAEVLKVSAELLLCLKDSNAKTREAAYQLIISIASRVGAYGYLKTVAAALAAETPHMRSAGVMAFSRIVFEYAWDDEELQANLPSLLKTVLVLIDEDSREVIKSVVGFIRICVAAIPAEQLKPLTEDIVTSLLKYHKAKSRFRGKIKIILKKLLKLFGYDFVGSFVPASEAKLLAHMKKEEQRQKRKKELSKQEKPHTAAFDDMIDSDEEGSGGDESTFATGATGFSKLTGRKGADKSVSSPMARSRTSKQLSLASTKKSQAKNAVSIVLPNEKDGEVVDMLSSSMARRVKFAEDEMHDDDSDDGAMEFDDEGRLVVLDNNDDQKQVNMAVVDDSGRHTKRRRTEDSTHASSRSRGIVRGRQKSDQRGKQLGAAYRSKKAGGDVKRKDQKLEPYAYVPLDGRSYSKKNRRAAVEQMSSVVNKGGKRKRGSR